MVQANIPTITSRVMTITPTIAAELLAANKVNRNKKPKYIGKYVKDMRAGNWLLTGEAIKISTDGDIIDGQNRLLACTIADTSFRALVVRNVDPAAQAVMDSGAPRTAFDTLTMLGVPDAHRVAAAARLALCRAADISTKSSNFTTTEIAAWVGNNPDITDTVTILGPLWRQVPLTPSVTHFSAWTFGRIDGGDAKEFFTQIIDGIGLEAGSPIIAFRRRMTGNYGVVRREKLDDQIALVFRTWNAFRSGEKLERLLCPSDIPTPI